MKRLFVAMSFIVLFISVAIDDASAVIIKGRPPQFTGGGDAGVAGTLNNELATAFQEALDMANDAVAKYADQTKLVQAFGDANAYASHAVEFWGYEGYDKIALLGGLTMALQMPALDPDALTDAVDDIEETGDAQIGASLGGGVNLGLHLGWFSPKARDWYINVKFFMYDLAIPYGGYTFNYETMTMGVGFNYQVVRAKKFGRNLFLWRGISIGAHFLFQKSSMDYGIDIASQEANLTGAFTDMSVVLDSTIKLKLNMNTYTIPIDIVTSLRILYFLNINIGAGIDFNFGDAEVIAKADADADVVGSPGAGYGLLVPGYVKGYASTEGGPFVVSGRLMAGVGITIAPVVLLDVVASYYIPNGLAVNVSAGFVW